MNYLSKDDHPNILILCRYSQITGMNVSTSNTAATVLGFFVKAVESWGCPSRVRGDRGSENVDVCTWMIMRRGPNRASFMWGT